MASSVKEILAAIAPQFPDDAQMDVFIELATGQTSACFFGTKANHAIALRTAHMMTLSDQNGMFAGGQAGQVVSKKEADLSVGFGPTGSGTNTVDADLGQTSYGIQLMGLRKGSNAFMGVTGVDNGC